MSRITDYLEGDVDIREFPTVVGHAGRNPTIGDLHANALTQFFFLVREGAITLKNGKKDYDRFVKCFYGLNTLLTAKPFGICVNIIDDNVSSGNEARGSASATSTSPSFTVTVVDSNMAVHNKIVEIKAIWGKNLTNEVIQGSLNRIVEKYKKEVEWLLREMFEIIDNATVNPVPKTLRYIGDTLADRTGCDVVQLKLFHKIVSSKIPDISQVILYSNHDDIFVSEYLQKKNLMFSGVNIGLAQAFSLQSFIALMKNKVISEDEVSEWINSYLNSVTLLSYSDRSIKKGDTASPTEGGTASPKETGELRIYMHAPNGRGGLLMLANALLGSSDAKNMFESQGSLIKAIESINRVFKGLLLETAAAPEKSLSDDEKKKWAAIRKFAWARAKDRGNEDCKLPISEKYVVKIIHGHDEDPLKSTETEINLNGNLGRGMLDHILGNPDTTKAVLEITGGFPMIMSSSKQLHGAWPKSSSKLHVTSSEGARPTNTLDQPIFPSSAAAASAAVDPVSPRSNLAFFVRSGKTEEGNAADKGDAKEAADKDDSKPSRSPS